MDDGVNSANASQESPQKYYTFRVPCGNLMTLRYIRDKFYKAGIKVKRHGQLLMPYHEDREYLLKISTEIGVYIPGAINE